MILKAQNICKAYGEIEVLKGICLSVKAEESVAIVGRSGEGKTTLLHILGQLEDPDQGQVEIAGKLLTRSNAPLMRRKEIGFIFQTYNLLEDFTALENVLMPARISRESIFRKKGLDLLEKVGLLEKADTSVKRLSGGERQRIAIARALCNTPNLILADEPTGNLDRANAKKVGEILLSLKVGLIIVTHDTELASSCDHQYVLEDGQLSIQ